MSLGQALERSDGSLEFEKGKLSIRFSLWLLNVLTESRVNDPFKAVKNKFKILIWSLWYRIPATCGGCGWRCYVWGVKTISRSIWYGPSGQARGELHPVPGGHGGRGHHRVHPSVGRQETVQTVGADQSCHCSHWTCLHCSRSHSQVLLWKVSKYIFVLHFIAILNLIPSTVSLAIVKI